jgi:hypothetical protein
VLPEADRLETSITDESPADELKAIPETVAEAPAGFPVAAIPADTARPADPAPRSIGVLSALGGFTGAAGLPVAIGLGAGLVPVVGGLAIGLWLGALTSAKLDRIRFPYPFSGSRPPSKA